MKLLGFARAKQAQYAFGVTPKKLFFCTPCLRVK